MPTKKKKTRKTEPVAYLIKVSVDRNGNFTYTANGKKGAENFRPKLGDTISWVVTLHRKKKTAFQVEFPGIAPFDGGVRTLRSASKPTAPQTVALLPHYQGNLIFKYTVTVSHGWYDDPVIGPVPADPVMNTALDDQVILLSADNKGNLTITPPAMPLSKGPVVWQWDKNSAYTDDFVLTFKAPVPSGWPPVTNSQARTIALNLLTAGSDAYTINTVNTGLSASSTLAIS